MASLEYERGSCALDPRQHLRMERPNTAPATIDDVDSMLQKLNSAIAASHQLLESVTPQPDGQPARPAAASATPQRAASVSASAWSSAGYAADRAGEAEWSSYEAKLRQLAAASPDPSSLSGHPPVAISPQPPHHEPAPPPHYLAHLVSGNATASVPVDLLDEIASLSLGEEQRAAHTSPLTVLLPVRPSSRYSLSSRSPPPPLLSPQPAAFGTPPRVSSHEQPPLADAQPADHYAPLPAFHKPQPQCGAAAASEPRPQPDAPPPPSALRSDGRPPQTAPLGQGQPRQPQLLMPAPQSQIAGGRAGQVAAAAQQQQPMPLPRQMPPPHGQGILLSHGSGGAPPPPPPLTAGGPHGVGMSQPSGMPSAGLSHQQLQQQQQQLQQQLLSGMGHMAPLPQGLPTGLAMMNMNGVPQLVAVMPQYLLPQTTPAGLLPQQPPPQHYPYHPSSLPAIGGWDPVAMSAAMGGGAPQKPPPPLQPHGGGWMGGGGGKIGKHDAAGAGGGEARHHPKRLMFRGREIRTVDEAHEMGGLRELAHEQNGCRFLQDQLDLRHKPHVDLIFEATKEDVVSLGMDPFGNYLVQKLVQYGTGEQRAALIDGTVERMVEVALNVHGTRVVQKMVECADSAAQQSALCAALLPSIMQLIRDMNANHVVQRCLAALPAELAAGIYDRAVSDCLAIATHRHGCCVLQRCLDHAPAPHREEIIGEVVRLAPKLVVDPFGNYVVQYILDLRQPPLTHAIVQALRGGFAELSLQKFSSNVIEKCLKSGDPTAVAVVANELTASEAFATLLHDPFANYVIQTLLTVGKDDVVALLVAQITPHLPTLRSTLYGKRIQAKLLKRCPATKAALPQR